MNEAKNLFTIGDYKVKLNGGQILVTVGPMNELVRVKDVKNIQDDKQEFETYCEKFKTAYFKRLATA